MTNTLTRISHGRLCLVLGYIERQTEVFLGHLVGYFLLVPVF